VFGQYAYYRARRYRLTRTVFRGIRFHQSGSPFAYALRSLFWGAATALSAGLALPWAQASLERYKVAHIHYGGWQGEFAGSGTRLFVRGIALWMILLAAVAAAAVVGSKFVDPGALARAATSAGAKDPKTGIEALKLMGLGSGVMVVAGTVYMILQAIIMRWWLEGLRVGPLVIATTLRKRQILGAYLRCFGYALLVMFALSIIMSMAIGIVAVAARPRDDVSQLLVVGSSMTIYLVMAVSVWVLYQMTIKLRVWRLAVDSISLGGFEAMEYVHADASLPSSAVGEGLADALGAGGI
jgi:uncharacterized membrane protein YjgN (DUF898 family)